jgi:hypothetical protein
MITLFRRETLRNEKRCGFWLSLKTSLKGWSVYQSCEAGLRVIQFGPIIIEIFN